MNQKQRMMPVKQCVAAMGIVLNVVGALAAMTFRLPIYMDSIGTVLVAGLLGPFYAGAAGLLGGIVSGCTFDMYSFYFAPAQMMTGIMAGFLFKTRWMKDRLLPVGVLFMTIPCTVISAGVTAVFFGGITSSGSSILVMMLNHLGMPLAAGVFVTQILTDYMDKLLAASLAVAAAAAMNHDLKYMIRRR